MGLDFGIEKRRKGSAYESLEWEECAYGRNCYNVKNIFRQTLKDFDMYDEDMNKVKHEYDGGGYTPITLGAMQILIENLVTELQEVNSNFLNKVDEYAVCQILSMIGELSDVLRDALNDYSCGIEWEYRVFDSY